MASRHPPREIRIGISACLLGQKVRYDGGHRRDLVVLGALSPFVRFVPVCPEVEAGLGVPRPPIRLVHIGREIRLLEPKRGVDHTDAMLRWSRSRLEALERIDLSGFVLKERSPSCGMEGVKLYRQRGPARREGVGLFADELLRRFPLLPVVEEGHLADARRRERFVERVFAYRRLRSLFAPRWTLGDLHRFHAAERPMLQARDPAADRALGRLLAGARRLSRGELERRYAAGFMKALRAGGAAARPARRPASSRASSPRGR